MNGKAWSKNELDLLKEKYLSSTNEELLALFPIRTSLSIYKKAYKLGFRKTPEMEFVNRSNAKSSDKNLNWKGGICYTRKGYRQILVKGYPRSDVKGYVMEHIYVWEKESGVPVPIGCCVHHLNGNKIDNRIENLCLMVHGAHTVLHHTGQKRSEATKAKISEGKKRAYAQ